MPDYTPPLDDMRFVLEHVTGLDRLPEHPDLGRIDGDTVMSLLEPAAKLASEILAPLNQTGDRNGAKLENGCVATAPGFKEAYAQYRAGGWNAVPFDPEHGGQGLPWLLAFAVQEMWQGANMAFGLCPLLNQGAVEAIAAHGSDEQKTQYLEKLVSGEWTGTMNLTEPQAGSDLAAIRTKAEPQDDGTYKITGQKIFITYGEHDLTDNIIHLVLARTPDAPPGVKGISLFIVPKILNDGIRNDVICAGIEHKLGIHASPTCTMSFGDKGGATGYLIGEENEGLKYMFTMMNNARLSVGLQGVAVAEAAYQAAKSYAAERMQGGGPIAAHPDVRRMLASMRAQIEAGRALTYEAALALDLARAGDKNAQARADILTPIVKAWCTDMAVDVSSTGIQIHGGMGYIEETGAAQFYRDARILPIYEGTNGIQAADLAFRKTAKDGGAAAQAWLAEAENLLSDLDAAGGGSEIQDMRMALDDALTALAEVVNWIARTAADNPQAVAAASAPYLKAFGIVAGGVMSIRAALAAYTLLNGGGESGFNTDFLEAKIHTAAFYTSHILPAASPAAFTAMHGWKRV